MLETSPEIIQNPLIYLRSTALPYADGDFQCAKSAALLRESDRLAAHLADTAAEACAAIETHLPGAYEINRGLARSLLSLKRAIFNHKPPKPVPDLPVSMPNLNRAIKSYFDAHDAHQRASNAFIAEYRAEVQAASETIMRMHKNPRLAGSLALTNPGLDRRLAHMRLGAASAADKQGRAAILSFARFIYRSSRKTSPLSRLANVQIGSISDMLAESGDITSLENIPDNRCWDIRLRIAPIEQIMRRIFSDIRNIAETCPISFNSSFRSEGKSMLWSAQAYGEPPASRVFGANADKMRSSSAGVALLAKVHGSFSAPPSLRDLQTSTASVHPRKSLEAAQQLVASAWEQGLLRPCIAPTLEEREWMDEALKCVEPGLKSRIVRPLIDLVDLVDARTEMNSDKIKRIEDLFQAVLDAADVRAEAAAFRPLIFEDPIPDTEYLKISGRVIEASLPGLELMVRLAPALSASPADASIRMDAMQLFSETCGSSQTISLQHFIEGLVEQRRKRGGAGRPTPGELTGEMHHEQGRSAVLTESADQFFDHVVSQIGGSDEVEVDPAALGPIAQAVDQVLDGIPRSYMLLTQHIPGSSQRLSALNGIYPGFGALITRFITSNPTYMGDLRRYLDKAAFGRQVYEVAGVFGFNGNRYRNVAERTLGVPPFDQVQIRHEASGLHYGALRMSLCPRTGSFLISDPDGAAVHPLNLGILTPALLPEELHALRALLHAPNPVGNLSIEWLNRIDARDRPILRLPRIRIGSLVVSRKVVAVAFDEMPRPSLPEVEFYHRFTEFAEKIRLPRHGFFQRAGVKGLRAAKDRSNQKPAGFSRTLGKPMPIDRECPIAVAILQKSLASSDLPVMFFEALPGPENYESGAFVSEVGIEFAAARSC